MNCNPPSDASDRVTFTGLTTFGTMASVRVTPFGTVLIILLNTVPQVLAKPLAPDLANLDATMVNPKFSLCILQGTYAFIVALLSDV